MNSICPVCHTSMNTNCDLCGFELPAYAFLNEEDAIIWFRENVIPLQEKWINNQRVIICKTCGKELQEDWKVCPYCLTPSIPAYTAIHKVLQTIVNTHEIRTLTLKGHTRGVNSITYSPDGKYFASGSEDKTIKIWDANRGRELRTLKGHAGGVTSVTFYPDGKYLASGSWDNLIKLWDANSGMEIYTFQEHNDTVLSLAFSSDGKYLASGVRTNSFYSMERHLTDTIMLWDVDKGWELHTIQDWGDVYSVAFSPDGKYLASGSNDMTIKIWDTGSGRHINTFQGHIKSVTSVVFSPDGNQIVSGSRDKTIKLWGVNSGKEIRTLVGQHIGYITSVAFSPAGKYLASGSEDKTIKLWDVEKGWELRTLSGHTGEVASVAFSPDGKYLASGSNDMTIKLWELC